MVQRIASDCGLCSSRKKSATMIIVTDVAMLMLVAEVLVWLFILLVVVAVALGKGRAENVTKAGTAV